MLFVIIFDHFAFPSGLNLILNGGVFFVSLGKMQLAAFIGLKIVIVVIGIIKGGFHRIDTGTADRAHGSPGIHIGIIGRIGQRILIGNDGFFHAHGVFHRHAGLKLCIGGVVQTIEKDAGHIFPVFL